MFSKPVLIIGCPRSGTTLLYSLLSEARELWSLGYESKAIIERYHSPATHNWNSGELWASDLLPESVHYMRSAFYRQSAPGFYWRSINGLREQLRGLSAWQRIKRSGQLPGASGAQSIGIVRGGYRVALFGAQLLSWFFPRPAGGIRLLEKTPENCLRLPFLQALFPDARVIYLVRDGRANVSSLIEGWNQPHLFSGYSVPETLRIPGYDRDRWAFTLIPGWRSLTASSLAEISAAQWVQCNQAVRSYFSLTKNPLPHILVKYEALIDRPGETLQLIADFIELDYRANLSHLDGRLPLINVVSQPLKEKWRRINEAAIHSILPVISDMQADLNYPTGL